MNPREEIIHAFRKAIDANIKHVEHLLNDPLGADEATIRDKAGRELALVRTKLQEAKMWGGKVLEVIGAPFPAELRDEAPEKGK